MGVLNFFQKLIYFLVIHLFIYSMLLFISLRMFTFIYILPNASRYSCQICYGIKLFSNAFSSRLLVHMLGILKHLVS